MNDIERRFTTMPVRAAHSTVSATVSATRGLKLPKQPQLVGYAALFNTETIIGPYFREIIRPGAFKESMREDDVAGLFNHSADYILGRTANQTVRLSEDDKGLRYIIDVNAKDPEAMRIRAIVARGDVRGSSFAFSIDRDEDEAWDFSETKAGKLPLRIIKRARLYDVSPVTFPAYPTTSVSANSVARLHPDAHAGVPIDVLERELQLLALEIDGYDAGASDGGRGVPTDVLLRDLELQALEAEC